MINRKPHRIFLFLVLNLVFSIGYGSSWKKDAFFANKLEEEPRSPRIVGGSEVIPNEFPFMLSYRMGANQNEHVCGGSIIDKNHALTAAHCIGRLQDQSFVVLGLHNSGNLSNAVKIDVKRTIIHPQYSTKTNENDIAILVLSQPVNTTRFIPIRLGTENEIITGSNVSVAGWGATSTNGSASPVLKKLGQKVISQQECSSRAGETIPNSMLCVKISTREGECYGDSGGPLFTKSSGIFTLHGLVSWGPGVECGVANNPAVYTRVSSYRQWISDQIRASATTPTETPVDSTPVDPMDAQTRVGVSGASYIDGAATVNYEGATNRSDWVGIYKQGHIPTQDCKPFEYAANGQWAFVPGNPMGTLTFKGLAAGDYNVQMFSNNKFCKIGGSKTIKVKASNQNGNTDGVSTDPITPVDPMDAQTRVGVTSAKYIDDGTATVIYEGAANRLDWVGVYKQGHIPNQDCKPFEYATNGHWVFVRSRPMGALGFKGLPAGNYSVQMFSDNTYCKIGSSKPLLVKASNQGGSQNGNQNGASTATSVSVVLNPYRGAVWNNQRKGNFHTHTNLSGDADSDPSAVTAAYANAGYKVLALTDHSNDHTGPTSAQANGLELVPGNELSNGAHVNAFFGVPTANIGGLSAIQQTQTKGGLSHYNHPNRSSSKQSIAFYVDARRKYSSHVGIEVFNREDDHALRSGLWDGINQTLFFGKDGAAPRDLFYWGFANDDRHSDDEYFKSFQFMLAGTRESMTNGSFYFCQGNGDRTQGIISSISVDKNGISISGQGSVSWTVVTKNQISDGGNTSLYAFSGLKQDAYIRAKVSGDNMDCYTQPIGVRVK